MFGPIAVAGRAGAAWLGVINGSKIYASFFLPIKWRSPFLSESWKEHLASIG